MLENSNPNYNSLQNKASSNKSIFYFSRVSPFRKKVQNNEQTKSYKKPEGALTFTHEKSQVNLLKRFSSSQVIPATTKNIIQKHDESNKKQIKVPSFFRKNAKQKQINSIPLGIRQKTHKSSNSYYQPPNQRLSIEINLKNQQSIHKPFNQMLTQSQELNEYSKLDNKINYLMGKIKSMGTTLDIRRQEKIEFMQSQKLQRAKLFKDDDKDILTFDHPNTPLKQFIVQAPQFKGLHSISHNPYFTKDSIYYVSQVLRAYKDEKSLTRQHLLSSIQYLRMFNQTKIPLEKEIQHMKVNLPRLKGYENKKTIIFDLDETLIHCNQNMYAPCDFKITINFPTGENLQVGINIRPFAKEILAALSKNFEIIVFTASHHCYANVVLDYLDPQKKHIHHRLFRQSCYCTSEGIYVKDLRIINRPLQKMILVDNAAYSYGHQPLNGVPIIPYYEGKNDYELQALLKYIQSLRFSTDVRQKNRHTFKLDRYHHFDDHHSLVQMLYNSSKN